MLCALGVDAKHLREVFPENILDVDLFKELRGQEVTIVGTDMKQLTRKHEARELKASGISGIYFGPFYMKLELWEQAAWLIKHWRGIDGFISVATKGTVAEVKQNGRCEVIHK
jgi:hypothetical protein